MSDKLFSKHDERMLIMLEFLEQKIQFFSIQHTEINQFLRESAAKALATAKVEGRLEAYNEILEKLRKTA